MFFFFKAKDGIRYYKVTGVKPCAIHTKEDAVLRDRLRLEHAGHDRHALVAKRRGATAGHERVGIRRRSDHAGDAGCENSRHARRRAARVVTWLEGHIEDGAARAGPPGLERDHLRVRADRALLE